jgi:ABC-type sulfate transport system permease component
MSKFDSLGTHQNKAKGRKNMKIVYAIIYFALLVSAIAGTVLYVLNNIALGGFTLILAGILALIISTLGMQIYNHFNKE